MDSEIACYVQTYKEISGIPSATSAEILPGLHDNLFSLHTVWSSQDFVKFKKNIFSRDYVIEKENLAVLSNGISYDISSVRLCAFSKSGKRRAILREDKSPKEKLYLEIWNEYKKETTFDLTECKEHGKVIENDLFKCFEWSSDEKYLLYIAEEKQSKSVSYFNGDSANNNEKKDGSIKGEEFAFKEDWGEACAGVHHTVLCLLEIETGYIEVLPTSKIGIDISFGQATWGPNDESIIFVGWKESPYRLGVWACRNRRSALYTMNLKSKEVDCLTIDDNICVRSPRLSPNFKILLYLENLEGGPHFKGAKLRKYDWITRKHSTIVDLVKNPSEHEFPGIYADSFPSRCWSEDGKHVYFSTIWRSIMAIVCVDIERGHIQRLHVGKDFGFASVLDVHHNIIIAKISSPSIEPCLVIGHINRKNQAEVVWKFLDANAPIHHHDINWGITRLVPTIANNVYPDLDYEIIVISPKEVKQKCPLIVMPHGGPHSCYTAGFLFRSIGFVKLGYMICLVNYRGSVGFGENNVKSLPGNIGMQDVADVQQAAVYVKNCSIYTDDIFIFGGSHGGFIGTHLCGQYPDFYKAAVLLNPSIDVCSKIGVSDIPDWNWVEAGFGDNFDLSTIVNPDHLKVLWGKSPIRYLKNVCAPTLLLLGKKDRRVPVSQGLRYYKLLKANQVTARVYMYDDNHQLLKTPHDGDVFMQTILWFNKYLSS